jgi:hypothetical protein
VKTLKELPVPLSCQMSERAAEVLRVWINDKNNMDTTLLPAFADPEAWGILLVDIARHAARAYEQEGTTTAPKALERIRAGFDAEWGHPTDLGTTSKMKPQ